MTTEYPHPGPVPDDYVPPGQDKTIAEIEKERDADDE